MSEPLTDSVLLQRASRGDAIAFSELVNRHYRRAVRVAFGMLGRLAPAEDVVQEAFARVAETLPTLGLAQAFYIALYRTIVVLCLEMGHTFVGEPGDMHTVRVPAWLLGVLDKLPMLQRAALLLRELEGFSYDALAATLRLRRRVIMRTLAAARVTLIEAQERALGPDKRQVPQR